MARFDAPPGGPSGFDDDFDADDFDFPVFEAPPRRTSRSSATAAPSAPRQAARPNTNNSRPSTSRSGNSRPNTSRPAPSSRSGSNSGRPATGQPAKRSVPRNAAPTVKSGKRPVSTIEEPPRLKSGTNKRSIAPAAPRRIERPRLLRPQNLRAVHFQIGGVLLFALALLLGWNAFSPQADGWLPRNGVLFMRWIFGFGALVFPFVLGFFGMLLIFQRQNANGRAFLRGAGTAFIVLLTALGLGVARGSEFLDAATVQQHGGLIGNACAFGLRRILGEMGAYIALSALGVISLLLWSENTLGELGERAREGVTQWWQNLQQEQTERKQEKEVEREARRREREERRAQERREEEELESDEYAEEDEWEPHAVENSYEEDEGPILPAELLRDLRSRQEPHPSPFLPVDDLMDASASSNRSARRREAEPVAPLAAEAPLPDMPTAAIDPNSSIEAPQFLDVPRIQIVDAPPPVSVVDAAPLAPVAPVAPRIPSPTPPPADLDLRGAVHGRLRSEELTPQEALEAQAQLGVDEDEEEELPHTPREEKPRRRFGEGPLMPEYFDEAVRALDPPLVPDLEGAEEELQKGVVGVQETLASFKIDARVTDVKRGPVITRYEVQPAPGVRVAAIANLDKDLARSLSALAVRIEAPVPGKNVVGIEVPNKKVHLVRMRDVLEQHDFLAHPSQLAFVLGKDIAGQPKWGDLTKMPHMLIAGATNSGKSVCLNSIIASILVRAAPDEVRFSLIDPKRVELTLYRGIPHLMHDVVVEPKQAVIALRRAIEEMDRRYRLFATRGVRNIASYNSKLKEGERPMPYIVIVIDELADLMMTAAAEFEKLICRLAQLARATGIHLIVATQRPSVNVITGVIKANIPARIAFAVASQVDSRTILDAVGAERLIGMGDMLYDSNNGGKSTRIQGAFLSEEEVNRIVECVKANYQYEDSIPTDLPTFDLFTPDDDDDTGSANFETDEKRDALFDEILEFVTRHQEMSASMIQRKFGIGYPRAGRIVDQLERHGILGPADGPKPRKVIARAGLNAPEVDDD